MFDVHPAQTTGPRGSAPASHPMRAIRWVALLGAALAPLIAGAGAGAESPIDPTVEDERPYGRAVDPDRWVASDLVNTDEGRLLWDHAATCTLRRADGESPRARIRTLASAPAGVVSRDQFVALVQRMETAYLLALAEGWAPGTSAMGLVATLDCRPRLDAPPEPDVEISISIDAAGFRSTLRDLRADTRSTHAETWPEAFRP